MKNNNSSEILEYKKRVKLKRLDLVDSIPLPGPLSVHLEPTNICNFKCTFCPESFDNYQEKTGGHFRLDMEKYNHIVNELKSLPKLKQLNFFMMGEPLVNKNLANFIKIAKENNLSEWYMLSTNGSLLTKEKYKDLCESGLDYLRVSIFGSNEQLHNKTTQSKIKLSRVRDNLLNFQEFKNTNNYTSPRTLAKMIETGNPEQNKEFLDLFDGVGDETLIEPLTNWNDPEEGNLSQKDYDYLLSTDHYKRKKETCPYVFYSLVIHSDLKVSICCVDWEKKTLIGDLNKESLKDIWFGEKLREFQLLHIRKKKELIDGCKNCTYLHTAQDNLDNLTEEDFLKKEKINREKKN